MLDVVKPEDLQAIIVRLMLAAQQGDVAAARLALAYTLGKPAPTVDPDALDLHEWELWQQMPVPPQLLAVLLGPLQVPLACTLARTILPLLHDAVAKELAQQLNPAAPPSPHTEQAPAHPLPTAPAHEPSPAAAPAEQAAQPAPTGPAARPKRGSQEKEPSQPARPARVDCAAPARQDGAAPTQKQTPSQEHELSAVPGDSPLPRARSKASSHLASMNFPAATTAEKAKAGRAGGTFPGLGRVGLGGEPPSAEGELQRWLEVCGRLFASDLLPPPPDGTLSLQQ